jgi:hypothetical protein
VEERGGGGLQAPQAIQGLAQVLQLGGEQQGAGVVIGAVAMVEIGHTVHGVLKPPGRQFRPFHGQGGRRPRGANPALAGLQQPLEQLGVALPHRRPHHLPPSQPGLLAQGEKVPEVIWAGFR